MAKVALSVRLDWCGMSLLPGVCAIFAGEAVRAGGDWIGIKGTAVEAVEIVAALVALGVLVRKGFEFVLVICAVCGDEILIGELTCGGTFEGAEVEVAGVRFCSPFFFALVSPAADWTLETALSVVDVTFDGMAMRFDLGICAAWDSNNETACESFTAFPPNEEEVDWAVEVAAPPRVLVLTEPVAAPIIEKSEKFTASSKCRSAH